MSVRKKSNEHGAALLFAMGLLSLFLLLAMAFAANSLLQRKIAANRGTRAMVEVIADSAMEQVRAAMIYYQRETLEDGMDINGLSIQSGTDRVSRDLLEVEKFNGKLVRIADFSNCVQKNDPAHSNDPTACTVCNAWLNSQRPFWNYVKTPQTASVEEIVGRYSYIMLPPGPRYQDFSRYNSGAANPILRWNSIEEYATELLKGKASNSKIPFHGLNLSTDELMLLLKREMEVYEPPTIEAYVCNATDIVPGQIPVRPLPTEYFHRFNLNRVNWSLTPIQLLSKDPVRYFQAGTTPAGLNYGTGTVPLINDPNTGVDGIQYLRRIGSEKATFNSMADRRMQIAANLIDYCTDIAAPPTSNIDSKDWDGSTKPDVKYSGNKGTPYIDRLGAVVTYTGTDQVAMPLDFDAEGTGLEYLSLNEKQLINYMGTTDASSEFASKCFIRLDLKAVMMAGLVQIYSNPLSKNYALQLFLNGDGLRLKNKIAGGTVSYSYQYDVTENGATVTKDSGIQTIQLTSTGFVENAKELYFKQPLLKDYTIRFGKEAKANGENGKVIFNFKEDDFQNNGYAAVKSERISLDNALIPMEAYAYISVLPFLFRDATLFLDRLQNKNGEKYKPGSFTWQGFTFGGVVLEKAELQMDRMVLSDLKDSEWGTLPTTGATKMNIDYVNGFSVAYDLENTTISGTDPEKVTFALGSIFCHDPRQNLFGKDWYPENKNEGTAKIGSFSATAALFGLDTGDIITATALVPSSQTGSDYPLRNPYNNGTVLTRDIELATAPGWAGNASDQHLSTAFFRNGPMESVAELGFIHRGAMWETLNLGNAAQPNATATDVTRPVQPSDYNPTKYTYDQEPGVQPGTSYQQGDGGLLDQVKIADETDVDLEKGAIVRDVFNLNLRDGNGSLNNYFAGDVYFSNFLANIRLGALQASTDVRFIADDYEESTNPGKLVNMTNFPNLVSALVPRLNWKFDSSNQAPPLYANRAQMLWYMDNPNPGPNRFFNAYNNMAGNIGTLAVNKALQDELSAKAMQYSTAGSLPTVYRALVIAQSIRDIGADSANDADGFTMKMDTDGNGTPESYTEVLLGKYEEGPDEITGQLRMIVTFVRDPLTCRVLIKDIEYLED